MARIDVNKVREARQNILILLKKGRFSHVENQPFLSVIIYPCAVRAELLRFPPAQV